MKGRSTATDEANARVHARRGGSDPFQVVAYARRHTLKALGKLVALMEGDAGQIRDSQGRLVDVEVPAAVQAKCAELILERGYGKSPQSIQLSAETPLLLGDRVLSVAEKILALKAARDERDHTVDLEASQQVEVNVTPVAEDLI